MADFDLQAAERLANDIDHPECSADHCSFQEAAATIRAAIERVRELEDNDFAASEIHTIEQDDLASRLAAAEKVVEAAREIVTEGHRPTRSRTMCADDECQKDWPCGPAQIAQALQECTTMQFNPQAAERLAEQLESYDSQMSYFDEDDAAIIHAAIEYVRELEQDKRLGWLAHLQTAARLDAAEKVVEAARDAYAFVDAYHAERAASLRQALQEYDHAV